jgi:UDP-glucose 4-epimerase
MFVLSNGWTVNHKHAKPLTSDKEKDNVPVHVEIGPRRPGDVEQVWANAAKALQTLNWKTERSLADGLQDAWRWQQHLGK